MTISMSDILCITNRLLCREDFLTRLERIAAGGVAGIVLREKDLSPQMYQALAERALPVCRAHGVPCIFHNYPRVAEDLGVQTAHLPLPILRTISQKQRENFQILGTSCHSVDEAREAEDLGCTYIAAGHIFATDCKKGMEPRGLEFLRSVCQGVRVPVWAIGGITPGNIRQVLDAGARGDVS